MKITYDKKFNIGYIQLREKIKEVETIKISDELNVDISPDGKIYGIELLNANEQLNINSQNQITFVNESNNKVIEFPIFL